MSLLMTPRAELEKPESTNLLDEAQSQGGTQDLMALCSGKFATQSDSNSQAPSNSAEPAKKKKTVRVARPAFEDLPIAEAT